MFAKRARLGAVVLMLAALTRETLAAPAKAAPAQPVAGRFQIYFSPHARMETFLLDTITGRVWGLAYAKDEGMLFQEIRVEKEDNPIQAEHRRIDAFLDVDSSTNTKRGQLFDHLLTEKERAVVDREIQAPDPMSLLPPDPGKGASGQQ